MTEIYRSFDLNLIYEDCEGEFNRFGLWDKNGDGIAIWYMLEYNRGGNKIFTSPYF